MAVMFKRMPWSALWDPDIYEDARSYVEARRTALASGEDADISLTDESGEVVALFWQHSTEDTDESAYQRALRPPHDDSMERHEERRLDHLDYLRRQRRRVR